VLLVGREFAVSGLRSIAALRAIRFRPVSSQNETFFQVVPSRSCCSAFITSRLSGGHLSLYLVVLFSIWSAVSYFTSSGEWWTLESSIGVARMLDAERQQRRALIARKRLRSSNVAA